jgi:hypothetical protein
MAVVVYLRATKNADVEESRAATMAQFISGGFSPDVARSILRLDFSKRDHLGMARLQAKASNGTLTSREREKLEELLRAADMLAILQSKARQSLKRQKGA